MTTAESDPYAPIKDAWRLYQAMTEDLAEQHAQNALAERPVDEAWDDLPARIEATKASLYEYAGPGETRKEVREHRWERRRIEGLNEMLDQTHESLVGLAGAELEYLKLEEVAQQAIAKGETADTADLERASSQVGRSRETLRQSRSTLSYRIEELADATGSGLFTPQDPSS